MKVKLTLKQQLLSNTASHNTTLKNMTKTKINNEIKTKIKYNNTIKIKKNIK